MGARPNSVVFPLRTPFWSTFQPFEAQCSTSPPLADGLALS